jgi:hypothetical protein
MPKQKITITFKTSSADYKFRILHVWNTGTELIVSSKLHSMTAVPLHHPGEINTSVEVEVQHALLPVRHYAIGMDGDGIITSSLNTYLPICIKREHDIPEDLRKNCLYENPETDSKERINTAIFHAEASSIAEITHWVGSEGGSNNLDKLFLDRKKIRNIIQKKGNHNRDECLVLLGLYARYHIVASMERKDKTINEIEANQAFAALHLLRDDEVVLKSLYQKYRPRFVHELEGRLHSQHETDGLHNIAYTDYSGLRTVGMFAAASATVLFVGVASTVYSVLKK